MLQNIIAHVHKLLAFKPPNNRAISCELPACRHSSGYSWHTSITISGFDRYSRFRSISLVYYCFARPLTHFEHMHFNRCAFACTCQTIICARLIYCRFCWIRPGCRAQCRTVAGADGGLLLIETCVQWHPLRTRTRNARSLSLTNANATVSRGAASKCSRVCLECVECERWMGGLVGWLVWMADCIGLL